MLLLCSQSVQLAFSPLMDSQTRVDNWSEIYTQLQEWKSHPQAEGIITSLLTTPIDSMPSRKSVSGTTLPTAFPIHIFTSRLSFYISFLDHLTSLLLLQSRLRKINDGATRSLKTAPWRAVQLCGLSLSNSTLWSWDPVIIAALIFAGSCLTYSGQQTELLEHLRVLEKMAGWNLRRNIQELEEFWKASR